MTRWMVAAALLAMPAMAQAFCGFYVGSADGALVNKATNVVLMRDGDETVLSMQNDYQGPPRDFAMVVPVPVVLQKENVKTLPREVFDRVDTLAAPRLVEYWEQDPCPAQQIGVGGLGMRGVGSGGGGYGLGAGRAAPALVTIEAQFTVGEYEIVILGAQDSAALDTWLRDHGYRIPEGAEPLLRPYVAQGMKFFVARVDAKRVKFVKGRAVLSPLRVAYTSKDFRLPVRLGLLNSGGTQDLVVHIIARSRYEAANFPNVTIPTNLEVGPEVRSRFGEFYAALFDRTLAEKPGAVVTEYAWQPTSCDPCPGPVLSPDDLATLGGDVLVPQSRAVAASAGVRVQIGRPNVVGSLDAQIVRRVIHRHQNELRYCAERAAQQGGGNQGKLDASLIIDGTGKVPAVKADAPNLPQVAACITQRMKRWRFPAPGDGIVQVKVPLMFRPDGSRGGFGGRFGQPPSPFQAFVLTRLHYRYTPGDLGEDLVFAPAEGIIGGRETYGAANSFTAAPASASTFQGRYIIRHPWEGKIACKNPMRGVWGGPPGGGSPRASAGRDLALAKRGALKLDRVVKAGLDPVSADTPPKR